MAGLTNQQKQLVQQTFGSVADESLTISRKFYDRFFEREPMARAMFQPDMSLQQQKFFQMIGMLIAALNDESQLTSMLHDLGKLHARYGVTQEQFNLGEEILLGAFGESLEDRFTPDVKDAWQAAYRFIVQLTTDIPEYDD